MTLQDRITIVPNTTTDKLLVVFACEINGVLTAEYKRDTSPAGFEPAFWP